jgi:hypothetical protein
MDHLVRAVAAVGLAAVYLAALCVLGARTR